MYVHVYVRMYILTQLIGHYVKSYAGYSALVIQVCWLYFSLIVYLLSISDTILLQSNDLWSSKPNKYIFRGVGSEAAILDAWKPFLLTFMGVIACMYVCMER